jgi:threonine dehydrogenase-like Zn-dependent dehydrogenase
LIASPKAGLVPATQHFDCPTGRALVSQWCAVYKRLDKFGTKGSTVTSIAAAVCYDNKRTELRDFAEPEIPPDGGLPRVELCGVCGSDWPYYQKYPKLRGPLILGHEAVGQVAKLGSAAAARFGVKEGDRVALEEYLPCGHCSYCRTGEFRLCDETDTLNRTDAGAVRYGSTPVTVSPSLWGGYSQFQYLHPNAVFHRVPETVPAKLASLALPLGNGVEWTYLQGKVKLGEAVLIQGPGQQGLACVVPPRKRAPAASSSAGLPPTSAGWPSPRSSAPPTP